LQVIFILPTDRKTKKNMVKWRNIWEWNELKSSTFADHDDVPPSQATHRDSSTRMKKNMLILFRNMIAVHSENHERHINVVSA
jgi:hypothetical protein